MAATCKLIAGALEKMAPLSLAEAWDNVGLLVGSPENPVKTALLTLDVTAPVIEEAVILGAELIITHHPFPFHAMKAVRTDTHGGAMLSLLLKNNISVYAAHTNLDAATGGVNDALAEALGLVETAPLKPAGRALVKIVTYVPEGHEEKVWQAMSAAGAGHIGNYSQCGFRVRGTGTFLPGEGTHPFSGRQGNLSSVSEVRLETVAPSSLSAKVIEAMIAAHPYEEAAYDVYPLQNELIVGGLGRVGDLSAPVSLKELAAQIKSSLQLDHLRVVGPLTARISRVAVCGGSGMDLSELARHAGAQVLITADIRYHEAQNALAQGLCVIDAGHFGTEYPILKKLQTYLSLYSDDCGWDCRFVTAIRQEDIWQAM